LLSEVIDVKNIFMLGLLGTIITGCVTVTNVNPSPTPVPTESPQVSATPAVTPVPTANPTPTPVVTVNGYLEGKLTIGPLCPVEPCSISDQQKQQAYEARKIQILMPDKSTIVKEIIADYRTEMYRTDLPEGRYFVNVTNAGIGNFELKEVTIEASKTTVLNIDIDTGIR
jgi:hypothetical protein